MCQLRVSAGGSKLQSERLVKVLKCHGKQEKTRDKAEDTKLLQGVSQKGTTGQVVQKKGGLILKLYFWSIVKVLITYTELWLNFLQLPQCAD